MTKRLSTPKCWYRDTFRKEKLSNIKNSLSLEKNDVLIDIGCGSGVQIKELGKTGYILAIGIDVNLNAIRFARERSLPDTEFIIADSQYLPIKSSRADKIICAEVIEHIKNPQHLVNEIGRVLKKGGAVVITTPNDRSVWGIYEFLSGYDWAGKKLWRNPSQVFFQRPVPSEVIFLIFQNAELNPSFLYLLFLPFLTGIHVRSVSIRAFSVSHAMASPPGFIAEMSPVTI